jgi:hypothetical protein
MKFLALQPFVPSGSDFKAALAFFIELGFEVRWDAGDYAGLEKDSCKFILQHYDNQAFAENFMLTVHIEDAEAFYRSVIEKKLPEKFGIRVSKPMMQPYGKEVNIIDKAGVCWHFVQ